MADLKELCIDGDCSLVRDYTAGTNITISDSVISAPNVYSKTQVDDLLDDKQNTLVAGDHINITGNTISASYDNATQTTDGLMSSGDKTKLDGITAGAEPNQNAFSNVKVGSTTVAADTKTDTLTLIAGTNVTLTPDASADSITIAVPDVYTKAQTDDLIDAIVTGEFVVVQTLPSTGEPKNIYLVPNGGSSPNVYDEYVYVNGGWEKFGSTEIDLSQYYTKTQTDTLLNAKQDKLTAGNNITISGNTISATDTTNNYFATSSTAAATAAKVATVQGNESFVLKEGVIVGVKASATNTAQNPTLNVNGTGAKSIYYNSAVVTTVNLWAAGHASIWNFYMYDGTNWLWMGHTADNNTTYTNMSQAEATTGTATTARAISAKVLNDTIDNKIAAQPTDTVGSASGWSRGTLPTLGTAIACDDITSWSAGTLPTLGTAIPADDITAWSAGTAATATAASGVVTFTNGTAPSLSYAAKSIPNVTGVGTLPELKYTAKSIPNVTGVGTLPDLKYTARSVPNVTGVGTLPSLTITDKDVVVKE